ncbi:hypothetical protein [Phaeacidiphilus oryzae]|uniref:hypothetical protein n=1 Tax=Phaeacidiphilus oryzae TaxID=348818 RepID=UPI001F3EE77A|nr:hypothetical protein [Phaeacidiphilus oryzae]
MGAVRDLRRSRDQQAPTRQQRRHQQRDQRRSVADARRAAKAQARERARARAAVRGPLSRTARALGGKSGGLARRAAARARGALRGARDVRTGQKVQDRRASIRKAAHRRRARMQLLRSALRFHGRRLLAAGLALPIGALGIPATALGRRLGWERLMYPGRRLYWRLTGTAREHRIARDQAIREARDVADARADADPDNPEILATVPRGRRSAPIGVPAMADAAPAGSGPGFLFDEAASEMEAAAQSFDPDGMMHVLSTCESFPDALNSVANTFRILAERADAEFPLEKEVAEALNDVFVQLLRAVDASGEVAKVFRDVHEQDIARHEDPRNGIEAERKWDTTNNET